MLKKKFIAYQDDEYNYITNKTQNKVMQLPEEKQTSVLTEQDQSFIKDINTYCKYNKVPFNLTSLSSRSFWPLLKMYKEAHTLFDGQDSASTIGELMQHFYNSIFNNDDYVLDNESKPNQEELEKEICCNRNELADSFYSMQRLVQFLIAQGVSCKEIELSKQYKQEGGESL